jgi:murein DD-endopeptidase MepM/ murein hydrolase activator NlpD
MKLILITSPKSTRHRYDFGHLWLCIFALVLIVSPFFIGVSAYYLSRSIDNPQLSKAIASSWQRELEDKTQALGELKEKSEADLQALTIRLAEAQTRLIRLEALGSRLIKSAKLREGEFDFSTRPAIGGIHESVDGEVFSRPLFISEIDQLMTSLDQQTQQMKVLESILNNRLVEEEVFLAGRPIHKGWMSSFFGKRLDPFNGRLAQHNGIDFAGKEDAEIIAVASGVVTWSGARYGYGNMVEVDHGAGFKTRYAHNKENLVVMGDIVRKGQMIARMGSTGRSTGPHVHFEVLKNDRPVNPERYVYRENH